MKLIRSQTWLKDDFDDIHNVLDETIEDFVSNEDEVINVQVVKEETGLSRFWIYIKKTND